MDLLYNENGIEGWCGNSAAYQITQPMLILTDPPYGIRHPTDYKARGRSNLASCSDHLPVKGDDIPFDPSWLLDKKLPCVLWGANHFASRLPNSSGWLVWDKRRPDALDQATCELAWTNYVKGVRRFSFLWHGMMREGRRIKLTHPTEKPVELWTWVLGLRWTPKDTPIFDPYMGTGSTLLAAVKAGRRAVGIDLERRYCDIAITRVQGGG